MADVSDDSVLVAVERLLLYFSVKSAFTSFDLILSLPEKSI